MGGVCLDPPTSPTHKSFQRGSQNHTGRIYVCIVAFGLENSFYFSTL